MGDAPSLQIAGLPPEPTPPEVPAPFVPAALSGATEAPFDGGVSAETLGRLGQAIALGQSGQFRQGAQACEQLARDLDAAADPTDALLLVATYARFLELNYRGMASLRLGATIDALGHLQRATWLGRDKLLPLVVATELAWVSAAGVTLEVEVAAANALSAQLFADMKDESFRAARCRAEQAVAAWQAIAEAIPPDAKELAPLAATCAGEIAIMAVLGRFAEAESARRLRAWDQALDGYDAVEEAIRTASYQTARIGSELAGDAQVALLNSALIPIARRRLEENRTLVEEGEQRLAEARLSGEAGQREAEAWKSALEMIRSWSPSVNVHSVSEVNLTLSVAINVSQVAQQRAAEDLDALAGAIARVALPDQERAVLLAEIAALKAAKGEAGDGFFKKLADFAEHAATLLKGLEEAAGPMGKVVAWVAPLAPVAARLFGLG